MDTSHFEPTWLGQCIGKYQVPMDVGRMINSIYDKNFDKLPPANKQLVGKIQNEHSLYYQGKDLSKMHHHNVLPKQVLIWLAARFIQYLEYTKTQKYTLNINSVWINQMKAHEYNPVHVHQGTIFTGLSSVMILKLPKDMGPEYSSTHVPMNGRLQILGSVAGQFAKTDYTPQIEERDFYIFPYDMRHCVYPMTNPQATRRTLSCNVDVVYNSIESRVA
jgi:hypothetical protein